MGKIKLLIKYFAYLLWCRSVKGYETDTAFISEFCRNVLNNRYNFPEYFELKDFRRSLTEKKGELRVYDKGAGSLVFSSGKRKIRDIVRYTASSYKTGKLLFRLARYLNPQVIVELGTSLGFGTMCLAKGSPEGKVYSLEACPQQLRIAVIELECAGVRNVELTEGAFQEKLPDLLGRLDGVDLVYFDGDHSKGSLIWQYRQCLAKVRSDTIFVVGDIHWSAEMDEVWKILCNDAAVTLSVDLFFCGLLFFRKGIDKQHHILNYF